MNEPAPGFFVARWRGEVPLARLFWRDTVVVGTLANLAASLVALVLLTRDAPLAVVAGLHFAPLPYNCFLFAAIWRAGAHAPWFRVGGALWLGASVLA